MWIKQEQIKKNNTVSCLLIVFMSITLSSPVFASYVTSPSSTTNGDSFWGSSLLRMDVTVSGSTATVTVRKQDGGRFNSAGTIYLKVGTYESHGVDHGSKPVYANTTTSVTFTDNLDNYPIDTYPKDFYVRYEGDDGGWAWAGAITITKIEDTGKIKVTIEPANAISAGAQWRVMINGYGWTEWFDSGAIIEGFQPEDTAIDFKPISGWNTPNQKTVSVQAGQTATTTGTYTSTAPTTGSVQITIEPEEVVAAGAQWRAMINGVGWTSWFNSGETKTGFLSGNTEIEFSSVSDWTSPSPQIISVVAGQTAKTIGTYTKITSTTTGSFQVIIQPAEAVADGAQWRTIVNGDEWTSWFNSGETKTGIKPGNMEVEFNNVSGWTSPAKKIVSVVAGQTTTIAEAYTLITQNTGAIQINIEPEAARTAGAQWRIMIDGLGWTDWYDSGRLVTGFTPGETQVEFRSIAKWITPVTQPVNIVAGQTVTQAGMYVQVNVPNQESCAGIEYEQRIPVSVQDYPKIQKLVTNLQENSFIVNVPVTVDEIKLQEMQTLDGFDWQPFVRVCSERGTVQCLSKYCKRFQITDFGDARYPFLLKILAGDTLGYIDYITRSITPQAVTISKQSGKIQSGQIIKKLVPLFGFRLPITVRVTWPGSDLDLRITKPSGEVLTSESTSVADFYAGRTEEYYVIDSEEEGLWEIEVIGVEVNEGGEPYELIVTVGEQVGPPFRPDYVLWTQSSDGTAELWEIDPRSGITLSSLDLSIEKGGYQAAGFVAEGNSGYVLWTKGNGETLLQSIDLTDGVELFAIPLERVKGGLSVKGFELSGEDEALVMREQGSSGKMHTQRIKLSSGATMDSSEFRLDLRGQKIAGFDLESDGSGLLLVSKGQSGESDDDEDSDENDNDVEQDSDGDADDDADENKKEKKDKKPKTDKKKKLVKKQQSKGTSGSLELWRIDLTSEEVLDVFSLPAAPKPLKAVTFQANPDETLTLVLMQGKDGEATLWKIDLAGETPESIALERLAEGWTVAAYSSGSGTLALAPEAEESEELEEPKGPEFLEGDLTIRKEGSGSGSIQAGEQLCGPDCATLVIPSLQSLITLEAIPAEDSLFVWWESKRGLTLGNNYEAEPGETVIGVFEKKE